MRGRLRLNREEIRELRRLAKYFGLKPLPSTRDRLESLRRKYLSEHEPFGPAWVAQKLEESERGS